MTILSADKFFDDVDFVSIVSTIKGVMTSDGSMSTILDFERVLDEADLYAFKNWEIGELVAGPEISKYTVTATFMWPEAMMPDPRGAKRLLPFDCKVNYKRDKIKIPIKIEDPSDYRQGTKKAKITEKPVWLVEIVMPKRLLSEIRTGSVEMEDQDIDLDELDQAYEQDLDKGGLQDEGQAEQTQQSLAGQQQPGGAPNVPAF